MMKFFQILFCYIWGRCMCMDIMVSVQKSIHLELRGYLTPFSSDGHEWLNEKKQLEHLSLFRIKLKNQWMLKEGLWNIRW